MVRVIRIILHIINTMNTGRPLIIINRATECTTPSRINWPIPRPHARLHILARSHHRIVRIQTSMKEMLVNPLVTAEDCCLLIHNEAVPLLLSLSSLLLPLVLLSQHSR